MVIDAKEYAALCAVHLENSDEDIEKIRVRHPEHPKKALLTAGRSPNTDPDLRVFLPLMNNAKTAGTCLPDICIDGGCSLCLDLQCRIRNFSDPADCVCRNMGVSLSGIVIAVRFSQTRRTWHG